MTWMIATVALFAGAIVATERPQVFAPGVISSAAHDSAAAFTPDSRSIYFGRSSAAASFILVSHRTKSGWSKPAIAPFSGQWLDMEPAMAPDGSYLIFVSNRPATSGAAPLDGAINGVAQLGKGANLWRVDRIKGGWSQPTRLPDIVNASTSTYAPSVAANGDLYFMRPDDQTARFRIFTARRTAQGYGAPVPLPFSDGQSTDVDPAVAPDQSFIVFGSGRHAKKDIDLFISFRRGGGWSEPAYLGDQINGPTSDAEPRLAPDHHTLYFSSERLAPVSQPIAPGDANRVLRDMTTWNNGQYNIWRVDLAPWLLNAGKP
jgi:Tol biopolymer transport system component